MLIICTFKLVGCRQPTGGGAEGEVTWSRYTRADRRYLRLSAEGSSMQAHLRATHVAFWNRLIPAMLAQRQAWMAGGSTQRASAVPAVWFWTLAGACGALLVVVVVLGVVQARQSRRRGAPAAAAGYKLAVGTAREKPLANSGTC